MDSGERREFLLRSATEVIEDDAEFDGGAVVSKLILITEVVDSVGDRHCVVYSSDATGSRGLPMWEEEGLLFHCLHARENWMDDPADDGEEESDEP